MNVCDRQWVVVAQWLDRRSSGLGFESYPNPTPTPVHDLYIIMFSCTFLIFVVIVSSYNVIVLSCT